VDRAQIRARKTTPEPRVGGRRELDSRQKRRGAGPTGWRAGSEVGPAGAAPGGRFG
jgi:hypothetical protein